MTRPHCFDIHVNFRGTPRHLLENRLHVLVRANVRHAQTYMQEALLRRNRDTFRKFDLFGSEFLPRQ